MAEQGYTIFEVRKLKTSRDMSAAFRHNFRLKEVPNASPELVSGNEELVKMPYTSFNDAFKKKYKNMDYYKTRALRKDAVHGVEIVLSYTPPEGEDYDCVDLDAWKKQSVQWLKDTFNVQQQGHADNVVSVVFHGDETAPHIHALIIPETKDGHLSARDIVGGPQQVYRIKESYGKAMEALNLRAPKSRSSYHLPYEKNQALKQRTEEAIKAIPVPGEHEPGEAYYKRAISSIQDYCAAMVGESNRQRWELNRKVEIRADDILQEAKEKSDRIVTIAKIDADSVLSRAHQDAELEKKQAEQVARKSREETDKKVMDAAEQMRIAQARVEESERELERLIQKTMSLKARDRRNAKKLYGQALEQERQQAALEWYASVDPENARNIQDALDTVQDAYQEALSKLERQEQIAR